jgi:hypothetical protein
MDFTANISLFIKYNVFNTQNLIYCACMHKFQINRRQPTKFLTVCTSLILSFSKIQRHEEH